MAGRQRLIVRTHGTAYADVWATECDHASCPFCWCATLVSRPARATPRAAATLQDEMNGTDSCSDGPAPPMVHCKICRGNGHVKTRIPPEQLRGRTCYDHWDYYDYPACSSCGGTGKVLR